VLLHPLTKVVIVLLSVVSPCKWVIYNDDNEEALDALFQRDGTLTVHKKNLQKTNGGNIQDDEPLKSSIYMWDLFTKKVVEYDFRIKILCELPPARSQRFGTNLVEFKGSLLWNSLSDEIKAAKSLAILKQTSDPGMAPIARATSAETSYWYTYYFLFYPTWDIIMIVSISISSLIVCHPSFSRSDWDGAS